MHTSDLAVFAIGFVPAIYAKVKAMTTPDSTTVADLKKNVSDLENVYAYE